MQKQTTELQTSITNKIIERMDEKLQPIMAEIKILKTKLENLEKETESLKIAKKQNNLRIFGIKQDENSNFELIQKVKKVFKTDLGINFEEYEINNTYRIGKEKVDERPRPTVVPFVNDWKKDENLKNEEKS